MDIQEIDWPIKSRLCSQIQKKISQVWQNKIYWSSDVSWPWMARNPNLITAWNWRDAWLQWNWHGIYLKPKQGKYDLSWKDTNSKHLYWDNISNITQNSACGMFPESRSYLMKRFKLFFGDVLRDWLLKQDVWLTIFFISKQLLVQSLHDQDQIGWKVWNFSSETFLEKVDLSKIVNLAWTVLTLEWTYQKRIDLLRHDLFFFEDILRVIRLSSQF